jgi:hypothetical protein
MYFSPPGVGRVSILGFYLLIRLRNLKYDLYWFYIPIFDLALKFKISNLECCQFLHRLIWNEKTLRKG